MAPEQFAGRALTSAADIFAFGVIAYQLVTGSLPFPSDSLDAAYLARIEARYKAPPCWQKVIAECLDPDPKRRPPAIRQVLHRLEPPPTRRRVFTIAGLGSAALLAAGAAYRFGPKPPIPKGFAVLLVPVAPAGRASVDDALAVGQLLRAQLDQSPQFELLRPDRITAALSLMGQANANIAVDRGLARRVALREAAPLVVAPRLESSKLIVEVERLGSHPYFPVGTWTNEYSTGSQPAMLTAVTEAGEWVRRIAGERAEDLAARARRPEEVTTANWDALLAYTKAEQARAAGDDPEAIRLLETAVALDPDFPSANMRLGDILIGHGHVHRAWLLQRRAVQLVQTRRLSSREAFRIRGMFVHDSDDDAQAETIFEQWAAEFPSDYLPTFYQASCQFRLGRPQQALKSLEETLRRAPNNQHAIFMRAQIRLQMGDIAAARADLDLLRGISAWWWRYEAEYCLVTLNIPGVIAALDKLRDYGPDHASRRMLLRAYLFAECGDYSRAVAELEEGIKFDQSLRRLGELERAKWKAKSALELLRNNRPAAIDAALQTARNSDDLPILSTAAMLLFRAGAPAAAEKILAGRPPAPQATKYRMLDLRVNGYRAMARGDFRAAARYFRELTRFPPVFAPALELAETLDSAGQQQEALEVWRPIALEPARFWLDPERYWPATHRRALLRLSATEDAPRRRLEALHPAILPGV